MKIDSKQKKIQKYLLILPIIFTTLIVGGTYIGFQLSNIGEVSDSIMWPLIFATLGFGISIVISILISKIWSLMNLRYFWLHNGYSSKI